MELSKTRYRMIAVLMCGSLISGLVLGLTGVGQPVRSASIQAYPQYHVASTSDLTLYESSFQNFGFYAQGRYWVFYEDSAVNCEGQGGCLLYASSTDGASWAAPTNVGIHVTDSDWSVVTNNTYVFYARYNETVFDSFCNKAILFGHGALNSGGMISWQSEHVVRAPSPTMAFPNEIVRVDTNNQVWVGYQEDNHSDCGGTGIQVPRVIHSVGTSYSLWTGDTVLSTSNSNNWDVNLAVLPGGAVFAAYWINTFDLHGALFNGTSWSSDEQISSSSDSTDVNSFVFASGGTVYAIWHDGNSGLLRFGTRTGTGEWTVNDIGLGEARSAASISRYSLPITATFDPVGSSFYIFWYNATRQAIDQWAGSGSSWVMTPGVFSTGPASGEYTITSYYQAAAVGTYSTFGVMWVDQPEEPYDLNFGRVTNPSRAPLSSPYFDYIVTIVLENQGINNTYGSRCSGNCTYITQLANYYGLVQNYSAVGHPSLPNYLALTGGGNYDTVPFDTDCYPQFNGCIVSAPNIVDRFDSSGRTWKAYMEDYSGGGCSLAHTSSEYVNTHNPFVYYTDIYGNSTRCGRIVNANPGASGYLALPTLLLSDLNSVSTASNYMWLTPNLCDDGHDICAPLNNTVSQQNQYLSLLVPMIFNSMIFRTQKAALFIVWDESATKLNNIVTAIWAGPAARTGYTSTGTFGHYSAVKTIETAWSLPPLTIYDSAAPAMIQFFPAPTGVGAGGGGRRPLEM